MPSPGAYVTAAGTFVGRLIGTEKLPSWREQPYNGGGQAKVTIATANTNGGTAATAGPSNACEFVEVQAHPLNTSVVAIGFTNTVRAASSKTNDVGVQLGAGESRIIAVDNTSRLFFDGAVGDVFLLLFGQAT